MNELHALHDHLQFSLNVAHAVGAEHVDSAQFLQPIIITPEVAPPPIMSDACCIVQPAVVISTCSFAISAASLAVNAQHPKYTHNASRSFEVVLAGKENSVVRRAYIHSALHAVGLKPRQSLQKPL